jgi:hypothetical protein
MSVLAVAGGPTTFVLARNSPDREFAQSCSVLVQGVLVSALLNDAPVSLDLVEGSTAIKRVNPIDAGRGFRNAFGEYRVVRLATQRAPDGRDEHLEAFVQKGAGSAEAFNVYDPLLQQLLIAAFSAASSGPETPVVDIRFDGKAIVSVRLGRP